MTKTTSRLVALTAALVASVPAAHAAVIISTAKTRHMTCASGVCAPTSKKAVLNVGDLAAMLADGDVTVTTGSGAVSIAVTDTFSWTSSHRLTLSAEQSVSFRAAVQVAGTGAVTITSGAGEAPAFFAGGSLDFWDTSSGLIVNGTSYALVGDIATLASDIAANPSGVYALAKDYDATGDGTYAAPPVPTVFTGTFEGLGHAIQNLTMDDMSGTYNTGFFSEIGAGGSVRDLMLTGVHSEAHGTNLGVLAGQTDSGATVANVSATGSVTNGAGLVSANGGIVMDSSTDVAVTGSSEGGLVRGNTGTILRCRATGPVSSEGAGGLAMYSSGTIQDSSATGDVSSPAGTQFGDEGYSAGGLVGRLLGGTVSNSYATGAVTVEGNDPGGRNNHEFDTAGGLVGWDEYGTISDSYAKGSVTLIKGTGTKANRAGGLAGEADVAILRSYSTGRVHVKGARRGGFAGIAPDSGMSADYWNTQTSGVSDPSQGAGSPPNDPGITGLTTAQLQSGLPAGFDPAVWALSASINRGYPYLIANPPPQ